jgi:tagatose 1,6-diphosphate aldolase GatY/KbaY
MLVNTGELLNHARSNGYAIGAFNIYNLEGATAVVKAAEEMNSSVILQLLPSALEIGGSPVIAMCLDLADKSVVPVAVHLDHCNSAMVIDFALKSGLRSIMADGSALDYQENIAFTRRIVEKNVLVDGTVEAELGKLSGEEDGLSVAEWEAKMTDPEQAADFAEKTGVSALAVCIGNIHGKYHKPPQLDFARLAAIAKRVSVPLVLHGTSGLPDEMIHQAIKHGVCKFNVNTEIRSMYISTLAKSLATSSKVELVRLMTDSIEAMKGVVQAKINLFCSADKAKYFMSS